MESCRSVWWWNWKTRRIPILCYKRQWGRSLLIGVRTDVAKGIQMKHFEVNDDHRYRRGNSDKMARTRLMVCEMEFKQNIGHIGNYVRVCGVHGHNMTMSKQWPTVWHAFWDRLAQICRSHGVHFLAGDFNMSLTEVPVQLRERGIKCDRIAWYPWKHKTKKENNQPLGFDSCAVFYLGGNCDASMSWSLHDIDQLTAFAGSDELKDLHE